MVDKKDKKNYYSEDARRNVKFRAANSGGLGLLQHVSTLNMSRLMQRILLKPDEDLTKAERRVGDHVMSDITGRRFI